MKSLSFQFYTTSLTLALSFGTGCGPKNLNIDPTACTSMSQPVLGACDVGACCNNPFELASKEPRLLQNTIVVNLYWGSYWKPDSKGQGVGFSKRYWIDDRAPMVFNSPQFWAVFQEYSTATQPIGNGSWGGGYGGNEDLKGGNLTRSAIETELGKEIDNFKLLAPTFPGLDRTRDALPNSLYVIWLPPNVTANDLGCAFGYHFSFTHNNVKIPYGVIGFLDAWNGYEDSMFVTEVHEVAEAVTNPDPLLNRVGSGWRDQNGNEIGDVCGRRILGSAAITEWGLASGTTISVQKIWSIKKCDCVDIYAYGAELTSTPIIPGKGHDGGPSCGVPGKPPCDKVRPIPENRQLPPAKL